MQLITDTMAIQLSAGLSAVLDCVTKGTYP